MPKLKKGSRRGEYTMNCPFCLERTGRADTKHHLGFNAITGKWQCFRCGAKVSTHGPLRHVKELGELEFGFHDRYESTDSVYKNLRDRLKRIGKPKTTEVDLNKISAPLTYSAFPMAYLYMVRRGFTSEEIRKHKLRVGLPYTDEDGKRVKKWSGRILFPFMDKEGKCTYVVGRSYIGRNPKYLNSQGSKATIVYGLEKVTEKREAILTEGIISAIAAERVTGIPGISLLGKSNSDFALSKIRSQVDRIYLSLDGGVTTGTGHLKQRLYKLGFEVLEVILPNEKDPDDLQEEYLQYFNKRQKLNLFA